ncbi:D-inositol 3-phosphate glycosyltransferase [compost metagenome]
MQPGGYSLYVGTIEPRKNIETLLDAYERLPLALRRRWPLILTGYKGWRSEEIHGRIEDAQRAGWARYLGFVPGEDLPLLFAGARLFAFPSLYEGFGLPVLEALSSGVPVVCSNSSSLPEVAGEAALMSEPLDVETLTANLQRGLEDDAWRTMAIASGLRHAATFSWERCARQTIEVYRKVVGS